jgi:outer membrane protein assembly factor BamB
MVPRGSGRSVRGRVRLLVVAAVLVISAAGCDWPMFLFGPNHSGFNNLETRINTTNVSSLTQLFTAAPLNGALTSFSPAVANGEVYVGTSSGLNLVAFDATGAANCSGSPKTCSPLWTGEDGGIPPNFGTEFSSPAVANGVVYIGSLDGNLDAFDAKGLGSPQCSSSPLVCSPLWTGATGSSVDSSPTVVNGVVYVASNDQNLYAFDAAGNTNCSGGPPTKTCNPLWTAPIGASTISSAAVANSVVYIGSEDHNLYAFDAAGNTNCSGSPKTCTPLWTAPTGGNVDSSPAVVNGVVYVGADDHNLHAFDAAGNTNCSGSPKTCAPLWTAPIGGIGVVFWSPAVANGVVYVSSDETKNLYAFDAAGNTNCSGTPKTCSPLWTAPNVGGLSPAVANGVLYVGASDTKVEAFDAAGSINCSGTPKTCNPLWISPVLATVPPSVAVANGRVYAGTSAVLYAFGLP